MTTRIAILLLPETSAALALLAKAVFDRANRLVERKAYDVTFVRAAPDKGKASSGIALPAQRARGNYDYLLIPPLDGLDASYSPDPRSIAIVRDQHAKGCVVASACLGALVLASAGLLDDAEATTHWAWSEHVQQKYPRVRWATHRMICDLGNIITSGGYLGIVDLALHIVERTLGRKRSHELGRILLVDSTRQRQSVFAQRLIAPEVQHGPMQGLARWIDRNLATSPTASRMANHCGLSLRSFHRKFVEAYRVTPRKFVQLKRIERAQKLLRESRRSTEQILTEVGVSDAAAFRNVFQRELGCSPAEYRKRLRSQA